MRALLPLVVGFALAAVALPPATAHDGEKKGDAPKGDAPQGDAPKGDAPKGDAPKGDAPKSDAPKPETVQPETTEGLERVFGELIAAARAKDDDRARGLSQELILPDAEAWLKKTFGDANGAKVAAIYEKEAKDLPRQILELVVKLVKDGKTELHAKKIEASSSPEATGLQKKALDAMATKVPLYTLRCVEPGKPDGTSIWSFVHVGGKFRLIGKLRGL